ncbi:MAG: GAF domain-containing protein [Deltaproteobacteria bacterium]|nr:GAF domain-containing protein [Deltaproteobacteria bacterium]
MSIQTLSTLLAAFLTFVIGLGVILRDRRQRHYRAFSILSFNLSFYYLATFFTATLDSGLARWIGLSLAAAIPTGAERFFRLFLAARGERPQKPSKLIIAGTALAYAFILFGVFARTFLSSLWFLLPFFAFIFGSLAYSVYLIYERSRKLLATTASERSTGTTTRSEATRLTYLYYGGAATVLLAATDFLPRIGLPFPTLGNIMTVVYLYFLSQTIFHYRLLDLKELLAKMVTLSALVLILSVIYGLLLAWVGKDQQGVFFFNTIVASFVILVVFEPLRRWVEDHVNRWLFAEKYEFSRRLRLLLRSLSSIIEVRPLVSRLLADLEETGRVTHVSIYLADPSGQQYHLAGHVGPAPLPELDSTTRRLFLERLRAMGLLTREGLDRELTAEHQSEDVLVATRNISQTMEELLADVCVPLLSDAQLLGILTLRDERLREAYASDELEILRQVAAQAAITLRNSKIYEQMKERERLAALGQMAAGLAHEIRNPLGAIKGAAQLLKASATRPARDVEATPESDRTSKANANATEDLDDDSEFLDIIVEEVDRLGHVVTQFLGYARPDRGDRQTLLVNDVVRKTLQLLRSEHGEDVLEIDKTLGSQLPEIRADPEQLRQVFLNLAINSVQAMGGVQAMGDVQAMDGRGRLRVTTRARSIYRGERTTRYVEVAFKDEGPGIDPQVISNIFIPFFTTKEGGTGLGLPICQRIIESHGGLIEVHSDLGKGATFAVLLPIIGEDVTGVIVQSPQDALPPEKKSSPGPSPGASSRP